MGNADLTRSVEAGLFIEAHLPRQAGLELSARLLAARPQWDIEVEDAGLNFALPCPCASPEEDLAVLKEACRSLERTRAGLEVELKVTWAAPGQRWGLTIGPAALGPWQTTLEAGPETGSPARENSDDRYNLRLPPGLSASRRWLAGETLILTALADHLSPPPGAPETKGQPTLVVEYGLALSPAAALRAGSGPVTLLTDASAGGLALELARLNGFSPAGSPPETWPGPLPDPALEIIAAPFKTLTRQKSEWAGYFGLIAVHLSPYLAARRLKTLAGWLRPEGALIVSGFAPGPQTAHLLRSAARAGLNLAASVAEADWAALKLILSPPRSQAPPLTGSLVPDLEDLPPADEFPDLNITEELENMPQDEGLLPREDDDNDDDDE